MRLMKYFLITSIIVIFSCNTFAQSGFVNNGIAINIGQGAYVNAGDYTNNQVSGVDGTIELDGTIQISGNFTNNASGNVFNNIETVPDGFAILNGNLQQVAGSSPINFENLRINNSVKTLSVDNCMIKGILTLNGGLDLNKNKLIVDNSSTGAINYMSGFIKSESFPADGLGEIEWRTESNSGSFSVPFGSGNASNDLNVSLTIASAPSSGKVIFATYPANTYNEPFPDGISSMDTFKIENIADRYWKIDAEYPVKPDVSIAFMYTDSDVDLNDNPKMIQANLKAIRYNDDNGTWLDMKMSGNCDFLNKTVTINAVSGANLFPYWTLSEFELNIPNAFTPNNDGKNDVFLKDYDVKILNRWGEVLYEGKNGWDGTIDGKPVSAGTYYYIASIPDYDKNLKTVTGIITLVIPE